MEREFTESMTRPPQNSSCSSSGGNNGDASNFECNICLDLAQDPIVTLCGHLFCWPCLFKWLHFHSRSEECPVCKVIIQEEKLVPLYGRGKNSSDPRSKSFPGINIPNRPAGQRPETAPPSDANYFAPHGFGQRPETAPPSDANYFAPHGFGFMWGLGGLGPMASTRFGNFAFSAAFGGLIPSLFNLQVHGYPDAAVYDAATSIHGFPHPFHGGHAQGFPLRTNQGHQVDSLKVLFLLIGVLVILALIWN